MSSIQCEVTFTNSTTGTLSIYKKEAEHGVFLSTPPAKIQPGAKGNWETGSDGIMTGSEGSVEYVSDDGQMFRLHWANPFVGSSWETHHISPDKGNYALSGNAGASSGGRAPFTFTASNKK
jgi:hypothetical protein